MTMFLHVQITISHFGMPTNDVQGEGFAEKALRTTMDVECPTWMDWFHGGLQVILIIFILNVLVSSCASFVSKITETQSSKI